MILLNYQFSKNLDYPNCVCSDFLNKKSSKLNKIIFPCERFIFISLIVVLPAARKPFKNSPPIICKINYGADCWCTYAKVCGSDLDTDITERCSTWTQKTFRLLIKLNKRVFFVSPVKEPRNSPKRRSIARHVQQSSVPAIKRCVMLFSAPLLFWHVPMVEWNIIHNYMYSSFYVASHDQFFLKQDDLLYDAKQILGVL